MRRFLILLLCCLLLTVPVSAASSVSDLQSTTTVSADGSYRVTVTVVLQLEEKPEKLVFPLPAQAKDVTLNGTITRATLSGGRRNVNLSGIISGGGMHTFTIQYNMPDSVTQEEDGDLLLNVQLLSGFVYPVEKMSFSIMLPGPVEQEPRFSSSYLQENVAGIMTWKSENGIISGTVHDRLQDREGLSMTLPVTEEMFPQTLSKRLALDYLVILMALLTAAAAVYWVMTMRSLPPWSVRRTQPPAGITAGELGTVLTDQGVDLTLMVLSWAQSGYILIQPDDNGRILLHKRMNMGNERSAFENKYFKSLFGKRKTVDGTGYRYAQLWIKAHQAKPFRRERFSRKSGNPKLLKLLAMGINSLAGLALATSISADTVWQILMAIALIPYGAACAWLMHHAARNLHMRKQLLHWLTVPAWILWIVLCAIPGRWDISMWTLLLQLLTGLALAYTGRRTELGRQSMAEIMGFRRYLKQVSLAELQRILRSNPSYYYQMAPYALALGMDRVFTRKCGGQRLPECSYLTTMMDGHLTAREWNKLLRETVNALDALHKRLPIDRLLGR